MEIIETILAGENKNKKYFLNLFVFLNFSLNFLSIFSNF